MSTSKSQSTVHPDLANERKNATLNSDEFAKWFYGNSGMLEMKRLITEELYTDLDDPLDLEYMSYEDLYTRGIKQAVEATQRIRNMQEKINPGGHEIYPQLLSGPIGGALMPGGNPMGVHLIMFIRILKNQSTPDIYEKFGKRAENFEIIGTYAQTELGHGTFVRGLETRADYIRETDEFVLNTPKVSSYKWWPGGLGHTVNYCVVMAQLYIDNDCKGIHMFLLQVRDEETHAPLPGIDIGDIGKKIGMPAGNNGYMGLKNVRIPRTQMLMRNAQVHADGTYVKSPVSQLNYFPMVYVRALVALGNAYLLSQAVTITTRYSAVRRQSPINPEDREPQILDHRTQQMKVIPEIATAIAYRLAGGKLWDLYNQTAKDVDAKDYSRLPELHAVACTLKASCSYDSTFAIERLRQACGGHGYLAASNLGTIYGLASAACTYEGENSVLYLQVGKILLKMWAEVLAGRQLMPTMQYLSVCSSWQRFPQWTGSWEQLVQALQYISTKKIALAYEHYNERLKSGFTQPEALNETGIELTQAAELHGRAFVTMTFWQSVVGNDELSPSLRDVLEQLLELYLLISVQRHLADILRYIALSEKDIIDLQSRLEIVLKKLRSNAVAIVDGFDFHDREVNSVLGCYDGNVYDRILESAKKSPINKRSIPIAFEKYLKPFMRSKL